MTCSQDWEQDHPQKYLRVHADSSQSVEFVRQEPDPIYDTVCYIYARQAYADIAEAECAQANLAQITYAHAVELKQGT